MGVESQGAALGEESGFKGFLKLVEIPLMLI
jgi:hypothetical protein